ncbi:hypothetical protein P3X46_005825 [Hevea brasiliensis]|uniref:Uncharacterized protein n=1 Tax=Hevea brasiliensis TaxID=3981 RepID=A0ABQ9MNQ7_HEVBR|nr:protein REGULATOR OF FATTY ACID COMPOSITION 3, chloroplastic [Hevea brasiliensis]KAJ9181766.1 hypothetical protein P3X46_005825 [Hevea brasiliensis]
METLLHTTATYPNPKQFYGRGLSWYRNASFNFPNGYCSAELFTSRKLSFGLRRYVTVGAKRKNNKKEDTHSFVPKPDEATGPFPEAVLLKEKKVQEDGKLLPEFADVEEQKLYEFLNLELESQLKVERMRHYEVVYLIHEKHAEEVGSVNEKVQGFLREKKGKIWRLNDWGMRRLAYKIQKAKNAHYILMNFELEAKWINEFKSMLDKDERVIRHLVIKREKAIMEDCPPPPEFHTLHAGMDDNDDEDDLDYDDAYDEEGYDEEGYDEDWDGEGNMEGDDDDMEDGIIIVNSDDNDDGSKNWNDKSAHANDKGRRNRLKEKVSR